MTILADTNVITTPDPSAVPHTGWCADHRSGFGQECRTASDSTITGDCFAAVRVTATREAGFNPHGERWFFEPAAIDLAIDHEDEAAGSATVHLLPAEARRIALSLLAAADQAEAAEATR